MPEILRDKHLRQDVAPVIGGGSGAAGYFSLLFLMRDKAHVFDTITLQRSPRQENAFGKVRLRGKADLVVALGQKPQPTRHGVVFKAPVRRGRAEGVAQTIS